MKPDTVIAAIHERAKRRHAQALAITQQYPEVVVMRAENGDNTARPWFACIIHPSSRTPGRYQVSMFDLDGFAYDYSEATYEQAVYSFILEHHRATIDMDLLDNVGETPRFMAGVIWSQLPDAQKWTTRLADIRKKLEDEE